MNAIKTFVLIHCIRAVSDYDLRARELSRECVSVAFNCYFIVLIFQRLAMVPYRYLPNLYNTKVAIREEL